MLGNISALRGLSASSRRYTYRIPAFLSLDRRFDDQVGSEGVSPFAYNVETDGGVLQRCKGFSKVKKYNRAINGYGYLPKHQGIKKIFSLHNDYGDTAIYPLCDDGLYKESLWFGSSEYVKVDDIGDSKVMFEYVGKDEEGAQTKYVVRSGPSGLTVSGAGGTWVLADHGFNSAVIFAERLFGVGAPKQPNRIYFSAQFLPYEFTEDIDKGGYIDVDPSYGRAQDMLILGDCIYVIWEYGITRLKAYGYQSEFVLSSCYKSTSRILRGVRICANRMVFVAQDGIYSFDGGNIKSIGEQIFSFVELGGCNEVVSGFDKERYYLSVHSNEFEGEGNNILLRYDIRDGKWCIFTVGATCIERIDTGMTEELVMVLGDGYAYCFDESDSFGDKEIEAGWSTPLSSWGKPESVKDVKAIYISAQGNGRLTVTLESEYGKVTKSFYTQGVRKVFRIPMRLRGRLLRMVFTNCDGCDFVIAEPTVIFTLDQGR